MSLLEISKSVSNVAFVVLIVRQMLIALVFKKNSACAYTMASCYTYVTLKELHYLVIRLSTFKDLILVIRNT